MKIVIQKSIAGDKFSYRPGQVVEMEKETAELWIKGGNAKLYKGEVTSITQHETGIISSPDKRRAGKSNNDDQNKGGE